MKLPIIFLVLGFSLSACSNNEPVKEEKIEPKNQVPQPVFIDEPVDIVKQTPQPVYDGTDTSFSCPHQEQRQILFTSKDIKDTLDIQITGADCDSAKIVLSVIKHGGDIVHKTNARALDYTYEDVGPAGVERMLKTLISSMHYENDLSDIDKLTESNRYYNLNRAVAIDAHNNNQPLFCHRAGKSFSNCYVYVGGESILVFSSGS